MEKKDIGYSMMRQPYRITMAKHNLTLLQKRVLTFIISKLQGEISQRQRGAPAEQLSLFQEHSDRVCVRFELSELVPDENYAAYKKAVQDLRKIDVEITLPKTVSKKTGKPSQETILTGLIEKTRFDKYSRQAAVYLDKFIASELIEISHGLTDYAREVMMQASNTHTQRIYEMISHWKDQEVYSLTVDKFKEQLCIAAKYPDITNLIRNVIKPAEKELKEIGDIFFEFSSSKIAGRIVKLNFIIKHRAVLKITAEQIMILKEEAARLLRERFRFRAEHFLLIKEIIGNPENLERLLAKTAELHLWVHNSPEKINNVPAYVAAALLKEFESVKS